MLIKCKPPIQISHVLTVGRHLFSIVHSVLNVSSRNFQPGEGSSRAFSVIVYCVIFSNLRLKLLCVVSGLLVWLRLAGAAHTAQCCTSPAPARYCSHADMMSYCHTTPHPPFTLSNVSRLQDHLIRARLNLKRVEVERVCSYNLL